MKFLFSFLLLTILTSVNLTAMELNLDDVMNQIVFFKCSDSDELIAVPVEIAKHSVVLDRCIEELAYDLPFTSSVFCAVVDCLSIIDSEYDVENLLCDYMHKVMMKSKGQDLRDLFIAGQHLRIQPLCDSFGRVKQKELDRRKQRLDDVLQQAKIIFENIQEKENSAIIIDVDDTALSRSKEINGENIDKFYVKALPQVHALYKNMIELGFKIFFLTARSQWSHSITAQNLINEGYTTFEEIICAPDKTRMQIADQAQGDIKMETRLLAQWKESERNKIAERFTIAGTLDDTEKNLQGENVGHPVLIPRFF